MPNEADYSYYAALEPNHEVRVDEDGYQFVRCPFVDAETPWSPNAGPDEVDCAFCIVAREDRFDEFPDEHTGDADPPISGGAHGGTHHVSEYAPCRVPNRAFTWAGLTRPVHEGIHGYMADIRAEWERLGGMLFYEIRSWWGYAARNCTGKSWHERAVAIDVNPAQNPMGSKRTPCPSDQPGAFVFLFKRRGAGWGGEWSSKCDAMHFSWGPNEGGSGVLYAKAINDTGEDELADAKTEILKAIDAHDKKIKGATNYIALKLAEYFGEEKERDAEFLRVLQDIKDHPPSDVDKATAAAIVDEIGLRLWIKDEDG